MDKRIILVGAFGEMVELAQICNLTIVGIIDNNLESSFRGIPIIGKDSDAPALVEKYKSVPIIISPDQPTVRKRLFEYYESLGFSFAKMISPLSTISPSAQIGKGTVIQSHCNVSADSVIGDFCKLNTFANVMHNNRVGSFTTVAPNAVLLGYVTIGESVYIGANSTVLPSINIDSNTIVGAGAVVTKNVANGVVVKGVPAK